MLLNPLTLHTPTTIKEATDLLSNLENVRLQAGGTFLLNSLKTIKSKGAKTPEHIISLQKITDLVGIKSNEDHMIIKSMTTIDDVFDSPLLEDNFKVFRIVCRNISTQPIRNMATVGGNLTCRYTWTEMPAVMIGLNADLHFVDAEGQEEVIPAEDFFKAAAKTKKLLTHIKVKRNKNATLAYQRVKKTPYVDIPLLSMLISTEINDNHCSNTIVAINNCVAFAQRDTQLEEFLNDQSLSKNLPEEALDHLDSTIYDKRSSDYKQYMFRVCIKNALKEIVHGNS